MKGSETSAFFSCAERTITRIKQNKHNNIRADANQRVCPVFIYTIHSKKEMMNYKAIQTLKGNGGIPYPERIPCFFCGKNHY